MLNISIRTPFGTLTVLVLVKRAKMYAAQKCVFRKLIFCFFNVNHAVTWYYNSKTLQGQSLLSCDLCLFPVLINLLLNSTWLDKVWCIRHDCCCIPDTIVFSLITGNPLGQLFPNVLAPEHSFYQSP